MMKPLHIHTRAQNHPDKQKSHKSRYMSRIGGCSPALAAIITSIDPIYSFYLVAFGLLWLLKFEFVRARFILNYFISYQCRQVLVKINNTYFE